MYCAVGSAGLPAAGKHAAGQHFRKRKIRRLEAGATKRFARVNKSGATIAQNTHNQNGSAAH
jgi:hypothetical protein